MSSCDAIREMLVLHAEGVLDPDASQRVMEHLAGCPECGDEAARIGRVREYLADPGLFCPTPDLTWQLIPEKLADRARQLQDRRWHLLGRGLPRWAWSAAALLVLAGGLLLTLPQRTAVPPVLRPVVQAGADEALFARMRSAYAREATTQYLAGCQNLLLDLAAADRKCDTNHFDVSLEVARARQLLQQKRMLDAELTVPAVVHARSLCDDLERFLISLSTSEKCETRDTVRGMERCIESEQLLLRINLAQSAIS